MSHGSPLFKHSVVAGFLSPRDPMSDNVCSLCGLRPDRTQTGRLPPWEVAKACAYSTVIAHMAEVLGQTASELLGQRADDVIAEQLTLVGGGHPTGRAVRELVKRHKGASYYPGKPRENPGGRPSEITRHQEEEMARVAMDLKKRFRDRKSVV